MDCYIVIVSIFLSALSVIIVWREIRNGFSDEVKEIRKSVNNLVIYIAALFCYLTATIVYVSIFNFSNVIDDFEKIYFKGI